MGLKTRAFKGQTSFTKPLPQGLAASAGTAKKTLNCRKVSAFLLEIHYFSIFGFTCDHLTVKTFWLYFPAQMSL